MTEQQQPPSLALAEAPRIKHSAMTPWSPTFPELVARLTAQPDVGTKDGTYFICTPAAKRDGKHCDPLTASLIVLDGDSRIDADTGEVFKGAPDPAAVHGVLKQLGLAHVIVSSHSNGMTKAEVDAENEAKRMKHAEALQEDPNSKAKLVLTETGGAYGADMHRYRVVLPCTHSRADHSRIVAWLLAQLHAAGVMLAPVSENDDYARAWFFPRVPDEARLQLWRSYVDVDGEPLSVERVPVFVYSDEHRSSAAVPAATLPALPAPAAVPAATLPAPALPGERSPIDEFNAKVAAMPDGFNKLLTHHGYTPAQVDRDTGRVCRWAKPGSTHEPGVTLLTDCADGVQRVFSHHDNDPLNDGEPHDAFDCFRILECNGDLALALQWSPEIVEHNARLRAAQDYFPPGEVVVSTADAAAEARGALAGIRAQPKPDPGALLDPKLIGLLAIIKHHDAVEWARLEADLAELARGPQLTAIKRAVDTCNAERAAAVQAERVKQRVAKQRNDLSSPLLDRGVELGFLITTNKKGEPVIVKEHVAAERMTVWLEGLIAFDAAVGLWYQFDGRRWAMLSGEHGPSEVLQALARIGVCIDVVGYSEAWLRGVRRLLEGSGKLRLPAAAAAASTSVLPFLNGILDLDTRQLSPTTPSLALTWCLPYDYAPGATCPLLQAWLIAVMDGDVGKAHFMRCAAAAVLRGRLSHMQVFLHLQGEAGSGKSTFLELLSAMVGDHNCAATTMRRLNDRPFEVALFKGKRLVTVGDMEDWAGKVDVLKSLTGRDKLCFEHKGKQRQAEGDFIYDGAVVILSNSNLRSTDKTGGLQRRRRTVIFTKQFSKDSKLAWLAAGGNEQLMRELPGFVNWLLELTVAQIDEGIMHPPAGITEADAEAERENNSVSAWFADCCQAEEGAKARIGMRKEVTIHTGNGDGKGSRSYRQFDQAETHLYPNYLTWCQATGVQHPSSHITFKKSVLFAMQQAGMIDSVFNKKYEGKDMHGSYILGVTLKKPG